MTEFALPSSHAAMADGLRWLELDEAAMLLGQSAGHVRRRAGDAWLAAGTARLYSEPGRKPRWQIRSDADPALSALPAAPVLAQGVDLRRVPKRLLEQASARKIILDRWAQAISNARDAGLTPEEATERFVRVLDQEARDRGARRGPARRTLYNWLRDYRQSGLEGLLDGRALSLAPADPRVPDDPFLAQVLAYWLSQRQPRFTTCYQMALLKAGERGWSVPHVRKARRFIARYQRANPGIVLQKRFGDDAFTDTIDPFLRRDYSTLRANEVWNADHHRCDVIVETGRTLDVATGELRPTYDRPWLTAWQDVRSRKIVGWLLRAADPNTDAVLTAFGAACRACGVPEVAYTDNGKDFDCAEFTGETKTQRWRRRKLHIALDQERLAGIYAALGIRHMHAQPFHGQSKPIERWFATLEDSFGRGWPTYFGAKPEARPQDFDEQLAAGRAPTFEDFRRALDEWIAAYNAAVHTGDAMNCSPDAAFAANLLQKRTAPDDLLDLLLVSRVGPLKVGQEGVSHQKVWYGQAELAPRFGEHVFLRINPLDVSDATAWTLDDKLIARVAPNRKLPWLTSRQELREARADQARTRRQLRAGRDARLKIHEDLTDTLLRAKRAQAKPPASPGDSPPPPPVLVPVRSPLEGQLTALRRAYESPLKKAVGDGLQSPGDAADAAPRFIYQPNRQDTDDASGFSYRSEDPDA